ncbi:family 1 glycosylhydrolase [Sphingobium rhizovicinum]|uniref:Family 1 glycosylhydrolase n=1 Tax=Sphingobium rhizovicinum TaxID=432308 RepID=A0ABV7NMQ2_9SPHN
MLDRRTLLVTGAAMAASPALAAADKISGNENFPRGFLWGAATAGHQVEGNNVASDQWFLENLKPTIYAEPSRDASNSFALWPQDMDLAKGIGLNAYRFSLEWARIEPEQGLFSVAMLDHYKRMIQGAHARGLKPIVTFNHFTAPRWFAAMGGWTNAAAIDLFVRFCDKAARHLADGISHAITFNEPNILMVLRSVVLPPQVLEAQKAMLAEAARRSGTAKFTALNAANMEDIDAMQVNLIAAHKAAKAAIKAVRSDLPVGFSLSMFDDQAVGKNSIRDAKRKELYGGWLDAARADDFMGVQNYERNMWTDKGKLPAPKGAPVNYMGAEVYAPSLAGAVRYAHEATGVPIFVTEHGVGTTDDTIRANLIPAALAEMKRAMDSGVPVIGYCHWSLIDNFEWVFGYRVKFGLHSVDPATFVRTAKPSAAIYGAIASRNAL